MLQFCKGTEENGGGPPPPLPPATPSNVDHTVFVGRAGRTIYQCVNSVIHFWWEILLLTTTTKDRGKLGGEGSERERGWGNEGVRDE